MNTTFKEFNKMLPDDKKSKMNDVISKITDFFESDKAQSHIKKYVKNQQIKTGKSSIEVQSNLAMHLLQMLSFSAVQLKNVPLLDVVYTSYLQFPGLVFDFPNSVKKSNKSRSLSRILKKSIKNNHSKKTLRSVTRLLTRPVRNFGGSKLKIQQGVVVDSSLSGYRMEALEEDIDILPEFVEIIRGNEQGTVNKRSLKHGDKIVELIAAKVSARASDRLSMVSCGGGGRVVKYDEGASCQDQAVIQYSKENDIDPMMALALTDGDPEFCHAVKDLIKQAVMKKIKNEVKRGEIEEKNLELHEKELDAQLSIIGKQTENKLEALKVIGEVIKSRNLTFSEVFQCGLDAVFDATMCAAITKAGIMLKNELVNYFTKSTIEYYESMKNNSDTVKEGEEFVKKTVGVLDQAGGGVFWMFSKVLDGAEYVYSGDILNVFSDVERVGNSWMQSDTSYTEGVPQPENLFPGNQGRIVPDQVDIPPTFTFDLSIFQRMIDKIYANGINLSQEMKEQIVIELSSWPAIVFYFAFLYHLYKNIQRERNHKKVLQVTASQGAAAGSIIGNLIAEEAEVAAESRQNMIDTGVSILTGGVSTIGNALRKKKDKKERKVIIESPHGGGAISKPVRLIKQKLLPEAPINLEQIIPFLPPIQPIVDVANPPPPPVSRISPISLNSLSSVSSSLSSSNSVMSASPAPMPPIPMQAPNNDNIPAFSHSSTSSKRSRKSNKSRKSSNKSKSSSW